MTVYDRWLEQPYLDAEAQQEAIEEVYVNLLNDECNPQNPSVFMEAINEGACMSTDRVYEQLKKILSRGYSYADLGHLLWDEVVAYCEGTAMNRAESIIMNGKKG